MIQLNETLSFDPEISFQDQPDEVRQYLQEILYRDGIFVATLEMRILVAEQGQIAPYTVIEDNKKTVYDQWVRPLEAEVILNGFKIKTTREYIEQSPNWRMHNEIIEIIKL